MANTYKDDGLKQGHQISDFPIKDEQRTCTDVFCTVTGIVFTLTIIVASLIVFNRDHYMRTSFPSDSQGRVCGYDLQNHPYIYFTNFPQIRSRVCVQVCPSKGDSRLNCVPTENIGCVFSNTPNFTVTFYQSIAESLQIGSFCVPTKQNLKQRLYQDIDVTNRYHFFTQIKSVVICGFIALGLSILYLGLVQWKPKLMNFLGVILGLVFVAIMALFMIFYPSGSTLYRILFGVIILLLMAVVGYSAFKSSACFDMHGVFLSYASQLLSQDLKLLIYIPLFLVVFTLFIIMVIWQLKSLWSSSPIIFSQQHVYFQLTSGSTTLLTILVVFQFIWGLSFIKQSFNFCISGNAVVWYDEQIQKKPNGWIVFKPLKYLFCYHFGSVVAGSFVNMCFSLFDYIFDVIRPDANSSSQNSCLSIFDTFFDLVRSDAMSYINLSGNPYCNASRYCQKLCRKSPIAQYSQSISRSYRICSHFLLGGIASTVSFFLQGNVSIFIVLVVFMLSLFISTFFISLHADAAEAIQIIFLLDYQFAKQNQKNVNNHDLLKLQLKNNSVAQEYHKESQKIKQKISNKK